jgi:hypothetical protein
MIGGTDKERSVSLGLRDRSFPFGAFIFGEICENSLLQKGHPRNLVRVEGIQLGEAGQSDEARFTKALI